MAKRLGCPRIKRGQKSGVMHKTITITPEIWEAAGLIGLGVDSFRNASSGIRVAVEFYSKVKAAVQDLRRIREGKKPLLYNQEDAITLLINWL